MQYCYCCSTRETPAMILPSIAIFLTPFHFSFFYTFFVALYPQPEALTVLRCVPNTQNEKMERLRSTSSKHLVNDFC